MNGKDLLRGFGEVDDILVQEMYIKGQPREQFEKQIGEVDDILIKEMYINGQLRKQSKKQKGANIMKIISIGTSIAAAAAVVVGIILGSIHYLQGNTARQPENPVAIEKTEEAETTLEVETGELPGAETEAEISALPYQIIAKDGNVMIYNRAQGKEEIVFENAVAVIGDSTIENRNPVDLWNNAFEGQGTGYAQKVLTDSIGWGENCPVAIRFSGSEQEGTKDRCGIYSIEENRWLCEPEGHAYLNLLGDELWTDSEQMHCGGSLMRMDGTVVAQTNSPAGFRRYVNYIVSVAEGDVYDLSGNFLFSYDPENCELLDVVLDSTDAWKEDKTYNEYFVARFKTPPQSYINSAAYAEGTWETDTFFMNIGMWNSGVESYVVERNAWRYMGHTGDSSNLYTSWFTGSGYVIQKWQGMASVGSISEEMFYNKNPEYFTEHEVLNSADGQTYGYSQYPMLQAAGIDEETGNLIIMLTQCSEPEYRTVVYYLYCDADYNVVKETDKWERREDDNTDEEETANNIQEADPESSIIEEVHQVILDYYAAYIEIYRGADIHIIEDYLDMDRIQSQNIVSALEMEAFSREYISNEYGIEPDIKDSYPYTIHFLDTSFDGDDICTIRLSIDMKATDYPPAFSASEQEYHLEKENDSWKITHHTWDGMELFEVSDTELYHWDKEARINVLRSIYGTGK